MIRFLILLCLLSASWSARAETGKDNAGAYITRIALLSIGPGDHLWSRFGHSALMVLRYIPGTNKYTSLVYNWGDAEFHDPWFKFDFMRGTVKFRMATSGTLSNTVTRYARGNRNVIHQTLNLSPKQVRQVEELLLHNIKPENRSYPYHHMTAGCGTKIRDLLDQVLKGSIRQKLEPQRDPQTAREVGRKCFAGHLGTEIFNDMFMGRLHDVPQSKYFAMYSPPLLSRYLQEVQVKDPKGGKGLVPLAGEPLFLYKRKGPPPMAGEGRTLIHLAYVWIVVLLCLGVYVLVGQPSRPRRAGVWLLFWALPMGLSAITAMVGALASTVIEGRVTELMLVYPLTDVALIGVGIRWYRGRGVAGGLLRKYAWLKLGLVLLSLLGHATGVLFQEPRILILMALICAVFLVIITHRFPLPGEERSDQAQPST